MVSRIRKAMDERDQGFTLIELLVVIIIIGILAAIAIPVFLNQRSKANTAAVKSDLKSAALAMESEYVDSRAYPGSLPATARISSGVTVKVNGGLSANDALFRDFVAACNVFPNWSCLYPFTAIPGSMRRNMSVSPNSSTWYGAGATVTEVANEIGWTGTVPKVPSTEVNLNAGSPTDSYCLVAYHNSKPSSTWHWDSLRGGLAQGDCP